MRLETVTALARGIRVVPVLVEGASMPSADRLPQELLPLVRRQAVELSHKQWDATSAELIRTLEKILDREQARRVVAAPVAETARMEPAGGPPPPPPEPRRGRPLGQIVLGIRRLVAACRCGRAFLGPPLAPRCKAPTVGGVRQVELSCDPGAESGAQVRHGSCTTRSCARAKARRGGCNAELRAERKPTSGQSPGPAPERKPDAAAASPTPAPERKSDAVAAPPKILRFESRLVDDKVELCYCLENAASATITPEPGAVRPLAQHCVTVAGGARKTYTLSARGPTGLVATRAISVDAAAQAQPQSQLVEVPGVTGKSRHDAIAEVEKAGLKAQVVEAKPDPKSSAAVDSVVAQSPRIGERVKAGERVTLEAVPAPAPVATAPAAFPRVGDTWQYNFRSMWKNIEPRTFVHRVTAVTEREVTEQMSFATNGGKASDSKSVRAESRFVEWRGQGDYFVEFNPFLQAFGELQPGTSWKSLATPAEDPFFGSWYSQGRVTGWDSVTVPAGTFKALRVELSSNRTAGASSAAQSVPARIHYVIWYSPEAKRTVKHVRTVYTADGARVAEDTLRAGEIQRPMNR